jgi:hypothetical protein
MEEKELVEEINTNNFEEEEEEINLNNLPMICLVEIAGFIDSDKNCLIYRNVSKKFNEAIQIKLFMKTKDDDAEFYKKSFLILNSKCHNYFNAHIYPYLINADSVYYFFDIKSEKLFNEFFNYTFNELKKIVISNTLNLKLNTLEKSFKKAVIRFIATMIIKNFEKEEYDSLDFSQLNPYEDAKEMIILLIRLMKKIKYLDLNKVKINDDAFFGKLIDKIEKRDEFTLNLEGIHLSSKIVKQIKAITDRNLEIKIIIDKNYNGQINFFGGKKMNKSKNLNKKKFKNLEFIK